MEKIGKNHMFGGYITPENVIYTPSNEYYKKKLYESFIIAKYTGINSLEFDDNVKEFYKNNQSKGLSLLKLMQDFNNNIKGYFSKKLMLSS